MTREETKEILEMIAVAYPYYVKDASEKLLSKRIDLWAAALVDDDFEAIKASLVAYIRSDTSGFVPSIGALRSGAIELSEDTYDDTEEVMAEIRRAVSRSSYYADDEFSRLSDEAQETVRNPGNLRAWAQLDPDEFETVVLSHLRRAYRNTREKTEKRTRLAPIDDERMKKIQANLARLYLPNSREQLPFEDD